MPDIMQFAQILERMQTNFALEFGSNPSDVSLRFMEVNSDESDAIYGAIVETLASFFVGTSTGNDLDNRLNDLLLPRKPGYIATTLLKFTLPFTAPQAVPIAVGTMVSNSNGASFITTADATILPGSMSIDGVPAVATAIGARFNTKANTLTNFVGSPPTNVSFVTNPQPVGNGQDVELDSNYRSRFPDYIKSLSRGTLTAIKSATIAVPGVIDLYVREQAEGRGSFYVYIDDGNGGTVNSVVAPHYQSLVDSVTTKLLSYRSGGEKCLVFPVGRKQVDVNFHVSISSGFDVVTVQNQAAQALTDYLNSFKRGVTGSTIGMLNTLTTVPGVISANPLNPLVDFTHIVSPTSDITVQSWEIVRAGLILNV